MYKELAKILLTSDGRRSGQALLEEKEGFIDNMLPIIGKMEIVSDKFSDSLAILKDEEILGAMNIVNTLPSYELARHVDDQICRPLTPVVMYALKKEQGIQYNYWDRTDPNMDKLVSPWLWEQINGVKPPHLNTLFAMREMILEDTGSRAETMYRYNTIWELDAPHIAKLIMLQLWFASPKRRNDSMILDLEDWDNIPTPFIPVKEPVIETRKDDDLGF